MPCPADFSIGHTLNSLPDSVFSIHIVFAFLPCFQYITPLHQHLYTGPNVKRQHVLIIAISTAFLQCAKEARPPGGPVDKTPPFVVETVPENGAVNVDSGVEVDVLFSEGIKNTTVRDALFITPFQGDNAVIRIRGRKIAVRFLEPLKDDRTYVITFGTGVSDYRSNKMDSSYTLAFSTGPVLDNGEIKGRVTGLEKARGVDVWAYQFAENDPDPRSEPPDYIVQCAEDGSFSFSHISPGTYRLFAVKDAAMDRLYQPGEDEAGVCFKDAVVKRDMIRPPHNFFMQMTREDTAGPRLVRASAVTQNRVALQFDEGVPADRLGASIYNKYTIDDTLDIHHFWQNNPRVVFAETGYQKPDTYAVEIHTLEDKAGNAIDTAAAYAVFKGSTTADTVQPKLLAAEPGPGTRDVSIEQTVAFSFSEPVDTAGADTAFFLRDTLGTSVPFIVYKVSLCSLQVKPTVPLTKETVYIAGIQGRLLPDLYGNTPADTSIMFTTINTDTLGSIAGTVVDPDTGAEGGVFVDARLLGEGMQKYVTRPDSAGNFIFNNVLPGMYLLSVFRDRDSSGSYSFGKVFPYVPAERFAAHPDTIVVKSRWTNDGNVLKLPSGRKTL